MCFSFGRVSYYIDPAHFLPHAQLMFLNRRSFSTLIEVKRCCWSDYEFTFNGEIILMFVFCGLSPVLKTTTTKLR